MFTLVSAGCATKATTGANDIGAELSDVRDVALDTPNPTDTQTDIAVEDIATDTIAEVSSDAGTDEVIYTDADVGTEIESDNGVDIPMDLPPEDTGPPPIVSDSFKVLGTVDQIYIWKAKPDTKFQVLDSDENEVFSGPADYQGSLIVHNLTPAKGYVVRLADNPDDFTDSIRVLPKNFPPPSDKFYSGQKLHQGFQYMKMRDGVLLSVWISLPGPPEDGPYPTLVNYSGYSPSQPGKSMGDKVKPLCGKYPILCEAPNFPSGIIAGIMGYAVVGVNMRGTGCSGGAYDYFEPLQLMDGYDIIETVAHQSWVKDHKVGMIGLSYPGISQLFVASTRPPDLEAICPFSVIANSQQTLVPGGILNDGFALQWITNVLDRAKPYGHGWIRDKVDAGDKICEENQLLHSQMMDVIQEINDNPFYTDLILDPLNPLKFVDKINVPVFMVGQNQDEQTGPYFPALFPKFKNAPVKRFTMTNGVHIDGFSPQILAEWFNFLSFYVKHEIPSVPKDFYGLMPIFMQDVYGAPLKLPPSRFDDYKDFDKALADYEAEPDIRVIFENGAADGIVAGAPQGTFERHFTKWPIPGTVAERWYFQADGSMQTTLPGKDDEYSTFESDPDSGNQTTLASGSVSKPQPNWDWKQPQKGKALSFVSPPLDKTEVMIGHASADLWVKSTADDADIQACLTEVRPDGKESYITCGWLRASHRTLLPGSTELYPLNSHYKKDYHVLKTDEWNLVRINIMPFSHIFRAKSRIRIIVSTPGNSMAEWRFRTLEYEKNPTNSVAHQADFASGVVLPVVPSVDVPTEMPECTALRGEPCRDYNAYKNNTYSEKK